MTTNSRGTATMDTVHRQIQPSRTGQATVIEQSRAVAEVQAAIIVAQQCPRNVSRAIDDMRETCKRKELADRAFFRYKRGNAPVTGPTIHLARELARVWGNIQYGLSELRRDDDYGQSEMLAFAWDVQTNSRCSSVVINPHKLYTGGRELTELRDIYENNANVGARRVREAIFAVLPAWFVEEAKDICTKTIMDGGGVPLPQRIANAIEVFGNLGITVAQLEAKLGTPTARWSDQDVAHLRVIRQSLLRNEIRKEDEFPPATDRVTADEITAAGDEPTAQPEPPQPRRRQPGKRELAARQKLHTLLTQLPLGTPADAQDVVSFFAGTQVTDLNQLTVEQVATVTAALEEALTAAKGDAQDAADRVWRVVQAGWEQNGGDTTPGAEDGGQDG